MKYGLECEFFVFAETGDTPLGGLPSSLTPDECGFLAEARGQACYSIREAVFSLKADIYRLDEEAKKLGLKLVRVPLLKVPQKAILKSRRMFSKGLLTYQNMYGYEEHKISGKKTAGIHISFTNPVQIRCAEDKYETHNAMFDFIQIIRKLDLAFKEEIKHSRRNPGFYELKSDGRIEYRSLPNNVEFEKIIRVLS